jgi:hypothetical protein
MARVVEPDCALAAVTKPATATNTRSGLIASLPFEDSLAQPEHGA